MTATKMEYVQAMGAAQEVANHTQKEMKRCAEKTLDGYGMDHYGYNIYRWRATRRRTARR